MKRKKAEDYVSVMDLSKPYCHVCEKSMVRNTTPGIEAERCVNPLCLIRNIDFHIPHKEVLK